MKRFLSLLATVVLVLQSVATSLVYAIEADGANPEGGESTSVAEATVEESTPDDESADEAPVGEESTIDEEVEEIEILDELPLDEDMVDESEVENLNEEDEELVEEFTEEVEEIVAESEDVKVERKALSYGKSFVTEQSWTKYSTNGLMVTAVDSLGAFPQGTDMEVTAIEEDEVFDLVNDAIEANVTKVRAVDITFWYEGKAIEPSQPINVTIRALNMTEPQTVVHIDDEENVEEIEADIKGKTAEFEAESFSIYAIVETAVLTVNFHNGEDVVATVYVKNADEVESLVYDPGIGVEEDGDVFRGWSSVSDYGVNTDGMSIEGVRENIVSNIGETKTLDFYAMIFKHYTVTYQDEDGVVIATDEVLFKGIESQSYEYTITQNYNPKKQDQNFEGWKKVDGGDTLYQHEGKIDVDGDITLRASVQEGHWLVFNENGKGATYIAPQFIETNAETVEPTTDMVRQGYTFGGWYKESECINAFTFGTTIDTGTTIYAKWTPIASANYTVLIWKQNVEGNGYDFDESVSLNGAVGGIDDKVTQQGNGNNAYARVNGSDKKYVGFHLKEFDQNVEIKAEGNSVVNVYYDRTEYTLTFQVKQGNKWVAVKSITALYGQNIRSNFPIKGSNGTNYIGASWSSNGSSIFDDDAYVSYIDTMQAESTTFRLAYNPTSYYYTYHVKYYVEALPGDTNTVTYDSKKFTLYHDAEIHFQDSDLYSTESEEFTDITGFEKYKSNPAYSNGKADFDKNRTISLYYTRQKYPINFMDGRYVDGNNNKLEDHSAEQLTTTDNILYGADITSYNKDGADYYTPTAPAGYVFEGRYLDDACTQKADFTTMPEGGLTVYAKWRQIQYRVFLHPNADGDETLEWGSENQAMNFRISHGGKVSAPEGRRDEYDFVGWYSDEGLTQSFNADVFVLNEKTVTSDYDKTSDFTDPMDKYGNGATTNSDIIGNDGEDRFRITKKLDLYAKWRSKLLGANGMNIVYDAVDGNGEPTDGGLYVDGSEAVAGSASTPSDSNYQFKYWVVQKWNGTEYVDTDVAVYPGESFEVLKANAYVVENENSTEDEPSYTYTIKLRAEYVEKGENEKTTIQYCPNYEGANEECTEVELVVNEEYVIIDNMFNRGEGYVFDGWKDSEGNEWNVGSGVGADNENPIPNVLYAQWDCDTDYHTENDGETCVNNKKKVNCVTGTIANGEYVVEEVEVEWNGKTWEETPVCMQVKCDTGYRLNVTENGTTCEPEILEEQSCGEFNIDNAKVVNGTFTSQRTENGYTVAPEWSMDGESCTYECEEGFHSEDEKTCVSNKKYVECETGEIANGEYVVERVEIEWNNGWPTTPSCTQIKCDDEYHLNATNNTCEKNIIEGVTCGTLSVDNAEPIVSTFTSVWSGNSYTTAPAWSMNGSECTYDCKDGFHTENMKDCIGNTTGVTCGRVEVEHGESIEAIVEINWNGKTWENVPSCVVKCDTGYRLNVTENGTTCEQEILEEQSCGEFNIENAKVVNGTFTSQWTENGYTVAPEWSMDGESCTYECEEGFHSEDGKTCVSDKKYVECETGEIANGEYVVERVEIEWNNGWPTTPTCTQIKCDDTYHEVETEGVKSCELNVYTITWNNDDGTKNEETYVNHGVVPEHEAIEKVNPLTGHIYTWNGWTPVPVAATEDTGYTATFADKCDLDYHDKNLEVFILDGTAALPNGNYDIGETTSVELECVPNTKVVQCMRGRVSNADYIVTGVNISWDVNDNAWEETPICDFTCAKGYKLNADKTECVKKPGGGGGSSGGGKPDEEEIELGGEVSDKCSVSGSNLSPEVVAAYLYACENDITTIRDINEARLGDFLTRAEMAKIVSVFATKELGMKPNTSKDCSNFEGSMNGYSQEMRDYMVMSCQLELMGIHTVNYEAIPDFMPNKRVSRAEFGTILSRILWGDSYEGTNSNYYVNHLNALKESNIITNIDPNITEYRSWVLLMIYRSVNVIKAGGTRKAESVEQDVNNELKDDENGAFIGLANPASAFCVEQGGENYVVKDAEGNEIGLCKLTDGTVIDEWEYYRNMNDSEKSKDADSETTTSDSQEESTEETNSETVTPDSQEEPTEKATTDETSGS